MQTWRSEIKTGPYIDRGIYGKTLREALVAAAKAEHDVSGPSITAHIRIKDVPGQPWGTAVVILRRKEAGE